MQPGASPAGGTQGHVAAPWGCWSWSLALGRGNNGAVGSRQAVQRNELVMLKQGYVAGPSGVGVGDIRVERLGQVACHARRKQGCTAGTWRRIGIDDSTEECPGPSCQAKLRSAEGWPVILQVSRAVQPFEGGSQCSKTVPCTQPACDAGR